MRTLVLLAICFSAAAFLSAQQIPSGTILPAMLDNTLDSSRSKPGAAISAKLRQDVPLPSGEKIKRNSKISGHVVAVALASGTSPASITLQFDRVEFDKKSVPISVGLRALASMQLVAQAKLPANVSNGPATTGWDSNMSQIGGQIAFNGQKIVKAPNGQVVGRVVQPGAILGVPLANPERGCAAGSTEQPFWVFSTNACGIYDLKDLSIADPGRSSQPGQIVLQSPKTIEVRGGSGWLLQVN